MSDNTNVSGTNQKTVQMDLDTFLDTFKPIKNHIDDNASYNGAMYETYGAEVAYIKDVMQKTPLNVWTVLDCDGQTCVSEGMHFVNRMGYLITEVAAQEDTFYDITDDDDTDPDDDLED